MPDQPRDGGHANQEETPRSTENRKQTKPNQHNRILENVVSAWAPNVRSLSGLQTDAAMSRFS